MAVADASAEGRPPSGQTDRRMDQQTGRPTVTERRNRRIALLSLLLLVPVAMAAVGWRSVNELHRRFDLDAVDVPAGRTVDYNGARLALSSFEVLPPTAGIPPDRTFVRVRLEVDAGAPSQSWLDCRLALADDQGRRWEDIGFPPSALERQFRKAGESPGSRCSALSVGTHQAGTKLTLQGYFIVPTASIGSLRPTVSAMGGRPQYLRFAREAGR
jgi:hypothetical protein